MPKEHRDTKQRKAIKDALQSAGHPLSPKEILDIATEKVPNLGIATVYRNIKTMVDMNELQSVEIPGQAPRYAPSGTDKTPLLYCQKSDRLYQLEGDDITVSVPKLPPGFKMSHYDLIIYGEFEGQPMRISEFN